MYVDWTTYFPDIPTMGAAGSCHRTVAGTAAAVDPDMKYEKGECQLCTHLCTMLCRDRGGDWFTFDISTELRQLRSDICDTCSVSACH